jgi:citrate lyase subunit beta / citryl-CoA lyase
MYRSMLFVPGDSEKKIAKSQEVSPDAIILDLEDAVAPSNKPKAREMVREYLRSTIGKRKAALWVRVNPITTAESLQDLAAVMEGRPDGIFQPKTRSARDVLELAHYLDALEVHHGIERGRTRIIPVATEVPDAVFALGDFAIAGPRLGAMTWGAEDLSSAIGAITNKDDSGEWSQPYQLVRSLCLFAASAAGVPSLDTLYADFKNEQGLIAASRRARRDGFSGKIAIHPAQCDPINAAFTPSADEIAHAQRIIDLFAANPGVGTLSLDGMMLDMPHLVQARKVIAMSSRK